MVRALNCWVISLACMVSFINFILKQKYISPQDISSYITFKNMFIFFLNILYNMFWSYFLLSDLTPLLTIISIYSTLNPLFPFWKPPLGYLWTTTITQWKINTKDAVVSQHMLSALELYLRQLARGNTCLDRSSKKAIITFPLAMQISTLTATEENYEVTTIWAH